MTCINNEIAMTQTSSDDSTIAPLYDAISEIVLSRVSSISEFELIRMLQYPPYELLSKRALQANLDLFQTHFLVFHCLHRLRLEWWREGLGTLRVEPLAIQLVADSARVGESHPQTQSHSVPGAAPRIESDNNGATSALQTADPLAAYYLDLDNLYATGEQDVERLLDSFWQALRSNEPQVSAAQRSEALVLLNFTAMPDNQAQLKRQFRILLHQYHPDKGGSNVQVRRLQWAYKVLQAALRYGVQR